VTVICTTDDSYVEASARESGTAAEIAATRKEAKYSNLPSQYTFYPISIETHGPLNETALDILCELGRRITACSGEDLEGFFLSQRLQFVSSDLTQFSCTTVFYGSIGLMVISAIFVFLEFLKHLGLCTG